MGPILDSGVLIEAERRAGEPVDFGQWASHGECFISAMTVSELLVGVHPAEDEGRRLRRSTFVESVLSRMPVLDFTAEVARTHSELFAVLSVKGGMVGAHDLIIAATALRHGHAVLTANVGEFRRVPGLKVVPFPIGASR